MVRTARHRKLAPGEALFTEGEPASHVAAPGCPSRSYDRSVEVAGTEAVVAFEHSTPDVRGSGVTEDRSFVDWGWIVDNLDDIWARTVDHVVLTVLAVAIGFAISFALSLAIRRQRRLQGPVVALAGILYSIPSLALFALLIPFTGIQSVLTAEIALVSYTVLILVRNILAGFDAVPPDVLEAARGIGFTSWQRLWRVELPIALPVIVAGLRIATVTTVGLVTVTALIGLGGLGDLIVNVGLARFFFTAVLVGSVGAVALAVLADRGFVLLQRRLTPWTARRAAAT